MDLRSRSFALLVFGLFAATLVWGGYALRQAADRAERELASSLSSDSTSNARRGGSLAARADSSSSSRTELMRMQIDRLSVRMHKLSEMLEQKTADYDSLKAELDKSTRLLNELMAFDPFVFEPATEATEETPTTKPAEETPPDLAAQLLEVRTELADLEKQAAMDELRIFELEDGKRIWESAASAALVRSGAAATPALADLLAHRRPEIRRWAATLLGEIGPDAHSAADALHEALSDTEEDVRVAARKALRKIENP